METLCAPQMSDNVAFVSHSVLWRQHSGQNAVVPKPMIGLSHPLHVFMGFRFNTPVLDTYNDRALNFEHTHTQTHTPN